MAFGEVDARGDFYQMEFRQHKRDYYIHKLGYSQVTSEVGITLVSYLSMKSFFASKFSILKPYLLTFFLS